MPKERESGIDSSRPRSFDGSKVMNDPSPYLPPSATPPPMPAGGLLEPAAVRVFGILHLILAGIGILMGIWSLFANQFNAFLFNADSPEMKAQAAYMQQMTWISIMSGVFMMVLAGLLLTSGIQLVRSRPDGVTWSHRYAWTSIGTKLVSLVVTVAYVLPAMNRMMEDAMGLPAGMPPGAADKMTGIMKTFTAITTVATPVISCLYPALALFFLSRPQVKEWVARLRSGAA